MQACNKGRSEKFMALNGVGWGGGIWMHGFYDGESLKRAAKVAKAKFGYWIADVGADSLSTIGPVDVGTS